jgi:glycosyltransferase involved in cell wall biosynthesis
MKFSLVLATVSRTDEVRRFLVALEAQEYREFELIVIDQNLDDRLVHILNPYRSRFSILHVRSERGLSRARNAGLKYASGDVVAFPDDDCWYPTTLLLEVCALLSTSDRDGVAGRSVDEVGNDSAFRFGTTAIFLDRFTVWSHVISYTVFLRRAVTVGVGIFDENLGVGAGTIFGSGEETDYVVRALELGYKLFFSPTLYVHHPNPESAIDAKTLRRAYSYGCGMGMVLAKHRYPFWFIFRALIRPFLGAILSCFRLDTSHAALYWNRCLGRIRGLRSKEASA